MRLNLFRRVRILPHLWLNLSRSGVSLSAGAPGLRVTLGRGRTRVTAGLPGTGLSVSEELRRKPTNATEAPATGRRLLDRALRSK